MLKYGILFDTDSSLEQSPTKADSTIKESEGVQF